jgi:hypothetical protein
VFIQLQGIGWPYSGTIAYLAPLNTIQMYPLYVIGKALLYIFPYNNNNNNYYYFNFLRIGKGLFLVNLDRVDAQFPIDDVAR